MTMPPIYFPNILDIRLILYPSSFGYNPSANISSSVNPFCVLFLFFSSKFLTTFSHLLLLAQQEILHQIDSSHNTGIFLLLIQYIYYTEYIHPSSQNHLQKLILFILTYSHLSSYFFNQRYICWQPFNRIQRFFRQPLCCFMFL